MQKIAGPNADFKAFEKVLVIKIDIMEFMKYV